jgi:hypothetical protein
LCALGGLLLRDGGASSVGGTACIVLGLYLVGAGLFGWPLPRSRSTLSTPDRIVVNGLRHLIAEGSRLVAEVEAPTGKGTVSD